MLKNIYFNLILVACMAILGTSCSKDFLNVTPYGKSDASTYYSNENELSLGLTAAYSMLNADQLQGWSSPFFIKNLPSDDSNCGGGGSSDQAQYQAIDQFQWQPSNLGIKAYYTINYFGIYRCNQVLNSPQLTSDAAKLMYAQAKFLRAYYFFELTTAFGDVPLRLTNPSDITSGLARSPQKDVYAQIEKDLTEAIAVLPNKSQWTGADAFRASKQTAQALLGKTYLYAKDYPNAAATFALIIAKEGTEVSLTPKFSQILRISTEFGSESLLEASFVSEFKNWGNVTWDRTAEDNRHLQLWGPRDFSDSHNILGYGLMGGWGFNTPTRKLYNALDDADPRKSLTAFDFNVIYKHLADSLQAKLPSNAAAANVTLETYLKVNLSIDKGVVDKALASGPGTSDYDALMVPAVAAVLGLSYNTTGWEQEGLVRIKYGNFITETTSANGATPELNFATNWRLIRYADVLLMAAEAYLQNGNAGQALIELNKVRARAGAALKTSIALTDIVKERQVELAFEGSRFFDLVRWGLADQELSSLGFKKGTHEHFPIPLDEMNSNPLIGSQNSGY